MEESKAPLLNLKELFETKELSKHKKWKNKMKLLQKN